MALVCSGGKASPAWGDPGAWDSTARTRNSGLATMFRATITDATALCEFGFDANQAGALGGDGFRCDTGTLKAVLAGTVGPVVSVPLDGVQYDFLVVALPTGGALLWRLSSASAFTFLFRSATGTTTPLYPAAPNYSAAWSLAEMKTVMLPTYATQWSAFPVYVAAPASVTPTFGASLMEGATDNGNMETGDPPTGWAASGDAIIDGVADERTGGAGIQSLSTVIGPGGTAGAIVNGVVLVLNTWYQLSAWLKNIDSTSARAYVVQTGNANLTGNLVVIPAGTWTQGVRTGRCTTGGAANVYLTAFGIAGKEARGDDYILKPITFTSMLGTPQTAGAEGWFEIAPTIPDGFQGGMIFCLDDETNPLNWILAYHDRTNLNVIECVAGVQTSLLATAATYGDGRCICVQKIGNTARVYYGAAGSEALIGTVTCTATSNVKMATFGSDVSVTYSNLAYHPVTVTLAI